MTGNQRRTRRIGELATENALSDEHRADLAHAIAMAWTASEPQCYANAPTPYYGVKERGMTDATPLRWKPPRPAREGVKR
jgi:hypothetical protein